MTQYRWEATNERGRSLQGECSAGSLGEAAAQLRTRGLAPLSVDRVGLGSAPQALPPGDAFALFNRHLAEMTSIGLPLPRAIREIASGLRRGRFKRGLDQVEASLLEGKSLEEAVGEVRGVFPPHYRWMLKAGTKAGNLPAMLSAVARNTEVVLVARRAFMEALLYPFAIVLMATLLGFSILAFFAPFYRDLAREQRVEAAGLNLLLEGFQSAGWIAGSAAGFTALVGVAAWGLWKTEPGQRVLRRLPLVGRIWRHLVMSRLLGTLGAMLRSNVPLPGALPIALGAAGSLELDRVADHLTASASEGRALGDVLASAPGVSPEVANFLGVAERTGDAPHATMQAAELLAEQALADSEALLVVLVPSALLIAGVIVGSFVVSMVLTYTQLLESLHS